MEGSGDDAPASPSDLLREITELKRSNQRLERAFVALSQILSNQQDILRSLSTPTESDRTPDPSSPTPPSDSLRNEFERRLKRGRASIVKDKIITHLERSGPVERSELKFLFVDQLRYTSKASFYRYVSELCSDGRIAESQLEGRTIISLASVRVEP